MIFAQKSAYIKPWSRHPESNRGPSLYESAALPAELCRRERMRSNYNSWPRSRKRGSIHGLGIFYRPTESHGQFGDALCKVVLWRTDCGS